MVASEAFKTFRVMWDLTLTNEEQDLVNEVVAVLEQTETALIPPGVDTSEGSQKKRATSAGQKSAYPGHDAVEAVTEYGVKSFSRAA